MQPGKLEVLQELGLMFIDDLKIGDKMLVKADNRPKEDIVEFDGYNDAYMNFHFDGIRLGVFFQEIREGKVKISEV